MKYLMVAGHGKYTRGKRSPNLDIGILEWEFNRDVATEIDKKLYTLGIESEFLNPGPIEIPLKAKVKHINAESLEQPACLILIHANAAGKSGWSRASGSRVFIPKKPKWGNMVKWGRSYLLGDVIDNEFRMNGKIPYHARLMRESGLYMLRKAKCPVVLVECGFMTNKVDAAFMASPAGKTEIAESITAGIRKFEENRQER